MTVHTESTIVHKCLPLRKFRVCCSTKDLLHHTNSLQIEASHGLHIRHDGYVNFAANGFLFLGTCYCHFVNRPTLSWTITLLVNAHNHSTKISMKPYCTKKLFRVLSTGVMTLSHSSNPAARRQNSIPGKHQTSNVSLLPPLDIPTCSGRTASTLTVLLPHPQKC